MTPARQNPTDPKVCASAMCYQRSAINRFRRAIRRQAEVLWWQVRGAPAPPPELVKHRLVREMSREYGYRVFVETGTYLGEMVDAVRQEFDRVISIELDRGLAARAAARFSNDLRVSIVQGDSGHALRTLLVSVSEPCIFWLDAHYSGGATARGDLDSPVRAELETIFGHAITNHVILIDDARFFTGKNGYPTLEEIHDLADRGPNRRVRLSNDILRIEPAGADRT